MCVCVVELQPTRRASCQRHLAGPVRVACLPRRRVLEPRFADPTLFLRNADADELVGKLFCWSTRLLAHVALGFFVGFALPTRRLVAFPNRFAGSELNPLDTLAFMRPPTARPGSATWAFAGGLAAWRCALCGRLGCFADLLLCMPFTKKDMPDAAASAAAFSGAFWAGGGDCCGGASGTLGPLLLLPLTVGLWPFAVLLVWALPRVRMRGLAVWGCAFRAWRAGSAKGATEEGDVASGDVASDSAAEIDASVLPTPAPATAGVLGPLECCFADHARRVCRPHVGVAVTGLRK